MLNSFKDVCYLFSCGALGKTPDTTKNYDIANILGLSLPNNMWLVLFSALKKLYEADNSIFTKEEFDGLSKSYMKNSAILLKRKEAIKNTLIKLEKAGFSFCMLKGHILSELYQNPYSRYSVDTDLLLASPDLENAVCDFLEKDGFTIIERPHTSHHAMARRADTGLFEFHLSLYDELFEDIWFDKKSVLNEDFRDYSFADDFSIKTLNYTDGAIFISLHTVKHFLLSGITVRHLCDMLLYNITYQDKIDWNRYNSLMSELGYDAFIKCANEIGRRYMELPINKQDIDDELVERVLYDMFCTHQNIERENMYLAYTEARFKKYRNESYNKYMATWSNRSFIRKIFPGRNFLSLRYHFLEKYGFLLPLAWVLRLVSHPFRKLILKNETKTRDKKISERMDMVNKLKMI